MREVVVSVLNPSELYELSPEVPELDRPVMVHAFSGFVDAGGGARLAREHLLGTLDSRVLATFDIDQLFDYRARRPPLLFVRDHWESYDAPRLELHLVTDSAGTPFLLLAGAEPDVQWERFVAAVRELVERFGVRLAIGLEAIPMAVPHTRPVGVTAHATPPDLVSGYEPWVQAVQVPGSVGGLLELRLGEAGHASAGFAVHVPHYVAQVEYPAAAEVLVREVAALGGLRLPAGGLPEAAARTLADVEEQVGQSEEIKAVVRALESQYDAYVGARSRTGLLAPDAASLPTADELGAELERFLADQARRGDTEA